MRGSNSKALAAQAPPGGDGGRALRYLKAVKGEGLGAPYGALVALVGLVGCSSCGARVD